MTLCHPIWAACPPPRCPLGGRLRGGTADSSGAPAARNRPPAPLHPPHQPSPSPGGRDWGRAAAYSPKEALGRDPTRSPHSPGGGRAPPAPRPACLSPAPAAAARPLGNGGSPARGPTVGAASRRSNCSAALSHWPTRPPKLRPLPPAARAAAAAVGAVAARARCGRWGGLGAEAAGGGAALRGWASTGRNGGGTRGVY